MAIIQAARVSVGGGGGGIAINGFGELTVAQSTNFAAGDVVINLPNTPVSANAVWLDYNGQRKYNPVHWTLAGSQITIQFSDPYVTDYEDGAFFNITYAY